MKLNVKGDGGNKKYSIYEATYVPPTTAVISSLINISNKEMIIKTQDIFEYYSRTTQDPDLASVMEKLSGVYYSNYRGILYVYDIYMRPKC